MPFVKSTLASSCRSHGKRKQEPGGEGDSARTVILDLRLFSTSAVTVSSTLSSVISIADLAH